MKALETSSGRSRELMQENEALRTQQQALQAQLSKLQVHIKRLSAGGARGAGASAMDTDVPLGDAADEAALGLAGTPSPNSAIAVKAEVAADTAAAPAGVGGLTPPGSLLDMGDVDMEDRSGGAVGAAGDAASSGGADTMTVHRLAALTDRIRKLLSDQGLPSDVVRCGPPLPCSCAAAEPPCCLCCLCLPCCLPCWCTCGRNK